MEHRQHNHGYHSHCYTHTALWDLSYGERRNIDYVAGRTYLGVVVRARKTAWQSWDSTIGRDQF